MFILFLGPVIGMLIRKGISDACGDPPIVGNATWLIADRYAKIVNYTCNEGYSTSRNFTTFNVTCVNDTYVGALTCDAIACTAPKAVDHGVVKVASGIISVGDTITQTCNRGFTGDGLVNGPRDLHFICLPGDVISPLVDSLSQCLQINCGRAPYIQGATTTAQLLAPQFLNDTVRYTCSPGLFVSGTRYETAFNLTCSEDGEFTPTKYPACVRPSCGPAPRIPLATPVSYVKSADVNDVLMYNCVSGSTLATDKTSQHFSIRCSMKGVFKADWVFSSGQVCSPIPCQGIPHYTDAVLLTNQTQFYFGDVAQFKCRFGYTLNGAPGAGSFTAACDANSVWSASTLLDCQPVVCGVETDVPAFFTKYGRLVPFPMNVAIFGNANLTVVCDKGAVDAVSWKSSFNFTCGQDGYFTSQGVCSIPCPSLSSVALNATATTKSLVWFANDTGLVTCNEGYTLAGTPAGSVVTRQTSMCRRDGNYTKLLPCTSIQCHRPPLSLGQGERVGEYPDKPVLYGTVINYTCPTGYYDPESKDPGFAVSCGADGKLTQPSPCKKVICPKMPVVANSKPITNRFQYFYYEDIFMLKCIPGFGPANTVMAVCQSDTTWMLDGACVPNPPFREALGKPVPHNSHALGEKLSLSIFLIILVLL